MPQVDFKKVMLQLRSPRRRGLHTQPARQHRPGTWFSWTGRATIHRRSETHPRKRRGPGTDVLFIYLFTYLFIYLIYFVFCILP